MLASLPFRIPSCSVKKAGGDVRSAEKENMRQMCGKYAEYALKICGKYALLSKKISNPKVVIALNGRRKGRRKATIQNAQHMGSHIAFLQFVSRGRTAASASKKVAKATQISAFCGSLPPMINDND